MAWAASITFMNEVLQDSVYWSREDNCSRNIRKFHDKFSDAYNTEDGIWRQSIYCPYVHGTIILFKWTGPLISQENKEIHSFEILRHKLCINFITLLHFNWFILCIQPSVIILSNDIWVELWIQYNKINITIAIKDLTTMPQWIDTPVLHGKSWE